MRFSFAIALAALALLCAPAAEAQHSTSAPAASRPPSMNGEVGARLADALASPVAEVRQDALEEAVFYAQYNNGRLDLTAMLPALLSIYGTDPDEQCRLAAVIALHAVGDEATMREVRRLVQDQTSRRVRVVSLGALVDHYGLDALSGARDLAALAEALLAEREAAVPPVVVTSQ